VRSSSSLCSVSSRDDELSVLLGDKPRNLAVRSVAVLCCGVVGASRAFVLDSVTGDLRRAFSLARRASSESGMLECEFEDVAWWLELRKVVVWDPTQMGDPGRMLGLDNDTIELI
jgi:hypothetical protein